MGILLSSLGVKDKEQRKTFHEISGILYWTNNIIMEGQISVNSDGSIFFCYSNEVLGDRGNAEDILGHKYSIMIMTDTGIEANYKGIELL